MPIRESLQLPYLDRAEAGQHLAAALAGFAGRADLLVLGLPRGGVVIACEVAEALAAPVDIVVVRKLGLPSRPELAMGAIASGGHRVLNRDVVDALPVPDHVIEQVAQRELQELHRRERAYRGARPASTVRGKCVILVDDGLATGSTMEAAVQAVQEDRPSQTVVAVPVAPIQAVAKFQRLVDEVVCPAIPETFMSVGQWYADFPQVTDEQVRDQLASAWRREAASRES